MTYGYLRVSTDKQDENNQKLGVVEKAVKMGVQVDEYIVDAGISGTKEPEKRKLGLLMEKLKPGDMIIASELSRLGRSLFMIMRILEFCMKHKVKVVTVKDGYELGDNIQSKVLAFAFGLLAEIERDLISQRTKEALEKKKLDGVILGRPKGGKSRIPKLTDKHDEIKSCLEKGLSYTEIGRIIVSNRATVKKYCIDTGLSAYDPNEFKPGNKEQISAVRLARKEKQVQKLIEKGCGIKRLRKKQAFPSIRYGPMCRMISNCRKSTWTGRTPSASKRTAG
jgi:DNA invertase Pin-like site-specific DNA recombinase